MNKPHTDQLDFDMCVRLGKSCACYNLRRAARVVTQIFDEFLRPIDLRSTQFGLLVTLKASGRVSVSVLAKRAAMDRTTLTRNLRLLEKKDMLRIEPGEDRRVREVILTGTGREVLEQALPMWEAAQAHVAEIFGKDRLKDLVEDLSALVSSVRKKQGPGVRTP